MNCMTSLTDTSSEAVDIQAISEFRSKLRHYLKSSEKICRSVGLTTLEYQILLHAHRGEGYSIATVAEKLQCRAVTAQRLLRRCENMGLVEGRTAKEGQGRKHLCLSAKGHILVNQLIALHQQELKQLLVEFPIPQHGKFCTSPVCWKAMD